MWVTSSLTTALTPTAVALGNFDGVHQGHQQVVKPVLPQLHSSETARSPAVSTQGGRRLDNGLLINLDNDCWESDYRISASDRPLPTVVTFNPHPREFFTGQPRALLTPLDEKVELLTALGVEQLVLLPFDREMADLSPKEFVEQILVRQLKAKWISVGQDFCFGHGRSGTSADLQAIAAKYGVEVAIVPIQNNEGERISSSAIRQFLLDGEIERANQLLGRPYTLIGYAIQGQQLGRTIGFPTANLQLPVNKFLPRFGVYAVRVSIDRSQETETVLAPNTTTEENSSILTPLKGVMNIGRRPTVDGINQTVEVHLLDWTGDLYGKTLTVSLEKFLRPEQKFSSLEELKQQITADCWQARSVLG
ncbi:bifunctional riboflavin kinase/FAD synthetase [Phormidium sp. LEGE 05292]|uniref:bifunctional riboflavin kinase/FAD synthetase n=1 Tax=[Phormidium] sp. LEGE 05292 TaxID=767427 RepID=UPI00188120E0|nr:bifunctional riboflavin kinase/FAD synthetase [Phormidium sp. LEGE 05292]MBE9224235.1 bifunctional riboflavin kinase/FAD synthetase [Phormidium sp. LEGE 05292]